MKRSLISKIFTAFGCAFSLMANVAVAELPQISNAHTIQPPPGAKVAAAYFTLTNPGTEPLSLTNVSSDIASKAELHLSKVEDDVAKMIKQDTIIIKAGESLEFKHGSYHVMFMGLTHPLESGDTIELVLQTSSGELPIRIPVISPDQAPHSMKPGMEHDMKMENSTDAK